jgi:hypothetical protein
MDDMKIIVRKMLRRLRSPIKLLRRGLKIKKLIIATSTKRKRFSQDFLRKRSKRFIAMEHLR